MPIYEYECKKCGAIIERIHPIYGFPKRVRCECGDLAPKVISSKGAIHTDGDVKWMESAVKVLQPDCERPITTRGEYKKYLKSRNLACVG